VGKRKEIFKVALHHKEVPQFFFEFCCGITEKIDIDDWTTLQFECSRNCRIEYSIDE
jgi:hypothetical protein